MNRIRRALIVADADKVADTDIIEFAMSLKKGFGVEIVSTDKIATELWEQYGVRPARISEVTGFPKILEDQLKDPKIIGGIMVVANIRPFKAEASCSPELAIITAGIKNHRYVTIATAKTDYENILGIMTENKGCIPEDQNLVLAIKAARLLNQYTADILAAMYSRFERRIKNEYNVN